MISTIKMASVLYDAVIICGGAEPEEFIRVRETLEKTGAEILIDHIDMQPGATVCVGFMDQVPVFGIAGNSDENSDCVLSDYSACPEKDFRAEGGSP